jgi:hypothetical protein
MEKRDMKREKRAGEPGYNTKNERIPPTYNQPISKHAILNT